MKKQSYAVLSAAITATLLGGVVPALANDAVVTVDKTKTTDEKSVEAQQQGVYQAVSQLMTHSDKAVAVNADAAADTAAVVAEKAADDTTTSTNKTAVDNNGFYVKNGLTNSYNSLTDMGLWVGGTDAKTGFRVDTAGNVNTTGDVSANAITAKQFLAVGSTDGSLVNAAFGVDDSGNVTMNGALNGFTFTQDGTWTDHYGFQDTVDMINGIGFGQVGTPYEGTLFVKDLVVNTFQNSGMTGGYVYLADGSDEHNNGASTAIGGNSAIWGDNSVAIGFGASVEMNLDKPGPSENGDAYTGYQGTAIGAYAKVAAQNGAAFGYQAEVYQENGVALGSESTVAEGDTNVVSVGHKAGDSYLLGALRYDSDLFRRITNVAAGVNPEDAVTVGQLKDNKDLATSGIAKWDEASNGASMNGVLNGVTLKNGNVTATDLTVQTINGKAVDKLANVDEVDTIIGHSVSKPETFSLVNGGKSLVDGINSNTALIEKNATSITNITDGLKTAFAGVDFKKLQEISKVDTKSLIAPTSYSLSLASTVPTSALLAEGDRPAPGEGSDSGTVTRPTPGDFDSVMTTGNATVGGDLAVSGNATVSKDLTVNGTSNLNGNVNVGKDLTVTGKTNLKGDTTVDGKLTIKNEKGDGTIDVASAIDKNQTAITEQGKAISTLGQGLSSLGKEVDSVGAISAALAGLHPLDYNGNSKFQLSAAVGTYDGTQAMAFGGFYHANPNVLLSLGASTSFGGDRKTAGNFGVTFRVGSGVSESPTVADNAALQDKLQKQQDQLTAQQKEIEELKAMVQNLTK